MSETPNAIDYILYCMEYNLSPKLYHIQNAKDELKALRKQLNDIKKLFDNPIAWARINEHGDVYSFRYTNNPYIDQSTVLPLYSDREGLKALYAKETLSSSSSKSES